MTALKKVELAVFWICTAGVWGIAGLYLGAMLLNPQADLQVVRMMGFPPGSPLAMVYGWGYTIGLLLVSVGSPLARFSRPFRGVVLLVAGACAGMTLLPMGTSWMASFNPAFYEGYVGEWITLVSLGDMRDLVSIARA